MGKVQSMPIVGQQTATDHLDRNIGIPDPLLAWTVTLSVMGTAMPLTIPKGAKGIHCTGFVLKQSLPLGQSDVAVKEW
jgi:hypothetical protein